MFMDVQAPEADGLVLASVGSALGRAEVGVGVAEQADSNININRLTATKRKQVFMTGLL
jgi:hypothetical protein